MEKPNEDLFIGGEELKKEPERAVENKEETTYIDGEGEYQIVNPLRLYLGKSYSDWTTDWFNWFLSADADSRTSGPVVFLRSHGLPNRITGAYISDGLHQVTAGTDAISDSRSSEMDEYRSIYVNDPNIRIGSDRLQIFQDQVIFCPIIVAYDLTSPTQAYKDWGRMQDFTGLTIDYGDNPPDPSQLTINNRDIKLGMEMEQFRIVTPIFTAVVPEAPMGSTIKDFLEDSPIAAGSYPAIVEGYFVMLKFVAAGSYWIHSWASAPRERSRPYFSELLYQIEVRKRPKRDHKGLLTEGQRSTDPHTDLGIGELKTVARPSRNERVFMRTLYEKTKIGELKDAEIKRFQKFFPSLPSR